MMYTSDRGDLLADELITHDERCAICDNPLNWECYYIYGHAMCADCLERALTEHAVEFLKETDRLQDFVEWRLKCSFDDFHYEEYVEFLLEDADDVEMYIQDECIEDFVEWLLFGRYDG